jgi:tRNA-specific 2-thiouridylase
MSSYGKKIFVGMSGGVDSSVSAALLQEQGYDVVGVFIKVWQADFLPCTWREERREAMRAAAHLRIPFLTLDLEKEYKEGVVDYMIREYGAGRVPNPDVMCNKYVKFGAFLDFAKKNGADFIATGHYAQIQASGVRRQEEGNADATIYHLFAGVDKEKDQSYFLWTLTQEQLAHTLFPVGHLEKTEVRALARKYGLPNAEKKDSQGLCFMGAVDMAEFLKHYLDTTPGNVVDEEGNVIGTHDGALLYTIGQRHGFTTQKQQVNEAPYFVVGKDMEHNTLTVAHRTLQGETRRITDISVIDLHLIASETLSGQKEIKARIRYRGDLFPALINKAVTGNLCYVTFPETIEGVATGQSIVFYYKEECLGGGIIGVFPKK